MKNVKLLLDNNIDFYSSLELLGDAEMYDETLEDFYDEIDSTISRLKKYFKDDDLKSYSIVVHDLKSNSKYLGFKNLAEIALNHELMSKSGDKDYIEVNIENLITEINKIKKVINEYLEA